MHGRESTLEAPDFTRSLGARHAEQRGSRTRTFMGYGDGYAHMNMDMETDMHMDMHMDMDAGV